MIITRDFKFGLGVDVKEVLTGFRGTVTARTQYLTGCNHYAVQSSKLKDGKPIDPEWFDEQRLVMVGLGMTGEREYRSGPEASPPRPARPR